MPNVVFFTNLSPNLVPLLTQHAPSDYTVTVGAANLPDAEKIAMAAEADFMILFPSVIADAVLQATSKLKLIQLVSAGFDQLNLPLCQELGIPIANNGGTNSLDVSEHTLALILGLYRRLTEMDRNVRNDAWRAIDSGQTTYTINGKTVGIIGLGNIGQQVAQRLIPFGAKLCYADSYPPPKTVEESLNITRVSLEELLQQSDVVTLHVPLNEETEAMISTEQLALMKKHAIIINTCRGPVIDEAALIQALQAGQIGGAGLDVLHDEPPAPDNPLFAMDNVLLTPHTAGVTYDTWSRRGEFIFQNLQRVWNGEQPLARVK